MKVFFAVAKYLASMDFDMLKTSAMDLKELFFVRTSEATSLIDAGELLIPLVLIFYV